MIKNVKIKKWCISCKNCENICPNIFKVQKWWTQVYSYSYKDNAKNILQAESMCPVNVISVEKDWNMSIDFKKAFLKEKKYLTKDTVELFFETKDFEYKPGQYVSINMKDKKWTFTRSYSIVKAWKNNFILCIKLLKEWRWWVFFNNISTWVTLDYLWAFWDFYLKNNSKSKTFISTGTGIAPMICMLEKLPENINKRIIFWVRYEEDLFYIEELKKYKNTNIVITVSRPSNNFEWNKWRVTNYLDNIDIDSDIYICGNQDMITSVISNLDSKNIDKKNIFYESFETQTEEKILMVNDIFLNWNIPFFKYIEYITILFAFFIPFIIIYYPSYTYTLWDISWWSLLFVMIIRPLADIFPKILAFRRLIELRKSFWILSSMVIVSALLIKAYSYWTDYINIYFSFNNFFSSYNYLYARIWEITWLILLITSNTFSQKTLWVWWKRVQRLSYLYFISGWLYIYQYWETKVILSFAIVSILWLLARYWLKIWK